MKYHKFFVAIPEEMWPAVEECFRLGRKLAETKSNAQVLLMMTAEVLPEWMQRAKAEHVGWHRLTRQEPPREA